MCCFSRPIKLVAKTKIFARDDLGGRQALAYGMDVEIDEELAMVLPLPVPAGSAEDAVTFVSLEAYPNFFADLEKAFPDQSFGPQAKSGFSRGGPVVRTLVVHEVGQFEASFVPTRADFARLDARFQLPADAWKDLGRYADWGFAVFRLKPQKGWLGGAKRQTVHPMAFTFPRRDPSVLFFPTVHMHDGKVEPMARFDHQLFAQAAPVVDRLVGWTASFGALGEHVDTARARGLVDGARGGRMTMMFGNLVNKDTWLRAPAGVSVEDVEGRGETYAYEVRATWAFNEGALSDVRQQSWRDTAMTRLPALCRVLRERVPALLAAKRAEWKLAPLAPDLPAHFMNGPHLWKGNDWTNQGGAGNPGGPGRVKLIAFTDRVEPQNIELGFSDLPDNDRLRDIQEAFCALVDEANG